MSSLEQPSATIKITSPAPQFGTQPLSFTLPLTTTIQELKVKITDALDAKPDASQQRLIYRGKILSDDSTISSVLRVSANGEMINSEPSGCYTFHLALRPTATPLQASPATVNMCSAFAQLPPPAGFSSYSLDTYSAPAPEGATHNPTPRANLTTVQTDMHFPSSLQAPLASSSTAARTRSLENSQGTFPQGQTSRNSLLSLFSESNRQPLYLLQGPNGYRALLIPPLTHQFSPTMAHSALTRAGVELGTNVAQNEQEGPHVPQLNMTNFGMGAFYAQAAGRPATNPNAAHVPAPLQQHPLAQRLYLDPADLVQRMRERANHLWLAIRLVVFVVLFSGGGGLRRTVTLGSLALLIFIWQTGILNEQWRNAQNLYRELFPPRPQQPGARTRERSLEQLAGAPPDPTITAQLLVQRDNERRARRWRDMFESVERGVTIFLASLVPGLHERHVEAHEERQRQREQIAGALAAQQQAPGEQAADLHEPQQQPLAEGDERPAGVANDMLIAAL